MKAADRQIESSFSIKSMGLFGWELVILHTTPSMFGKFWCMLGGGVEV